MQFVEWIRGGRRRVGSVERRRRAAIGRCRFYRGGERMQHWRTNHEKIGPHRRANAEGNERVESHTEQVPFFGSNGSKHVRNKYFFFRYSVVTFGGSGVFDKPRSLVLDDNIFTDYASILAYFDNIPAGNTIKSLVKKGIYVNNYR